ncbi:MAG: hypothetical protein QXI09_02485 [Candidatus Aenigmatarchaeota archaeon]
MGENEKNVRLRTLKGEEQFYNLTLPAMEHSYNHFLRQYSRRDRGLSEASFLLEYLFGENGFFPQLENITQFMQDKIPGMIVEVEVMENLKKEIVSLLLETYNRALKRGLLFPEEFSEMAVYFTTLIRYGEYRAGINEVRIADLKGNLWELVYGYEPPVRAFIRRKIHENNNYYRGENKEWWFLTFWIVDANDNSLLKNRKSTNWRFTISYVPLRGIEETIFSPINLLKEEFRERVKNRQLELLCLPESLSLSCDPIKVEKYYEEIYGKGIRSSLYI